MNAKHPLLRKLREGLLWHCTSVENYRQIVRDGTIKPRVETESSYDFSYCCKELKAVSLFDFARPSIMQVLQHASGKWLSCIARHAPLTIALGFRREALSGKLIYYPDMKKFGGKRVPGNIIPHVEVCHRGEISLGKATAYLLICSGNLERFEFEETLTEQRITEVKAAFQAECSRIESEGARIGPMSVAQQQEFDERLAQTRRVLAKHRRA